MLNGSYNAFHQLKKLGNRLLAGTLIFMLMSLCVVVFDWTETIETIFFLSAWLFLVLYEHKAVFLKR
jgi:hypothetical protein